MKPLLRVDMQDRMLGYTSKQKAHQDGILHRAFSVFLYHDGKMLLQRRALHKYHTPGRWTNACCSHPWQDGSVVPCAIQRLQEEIGADVTDLEELFSFVYYYGFHDTLKEYEYDHVLIADYNGSLSLNEEEVCEMRWVSYDALREEVAVHPEWFTPWFIIALPRVLAHIEKRDSTCQK